MPTTQICYFSSILSLSFSFIHNYARGVTMNAHSLNGQVRSAVTSLLAIVCISQFSAQAGEQPRTLQTFGVQVKHGQPVYPLPNNVALGLFNPEDPFLDVAYANDGRVQVFQNLGNGLFSDAPVFDRRVSGEVAAMQWRMRNPYFRSPSDLLITYTDGREETIANEWMSEQTRSFASLPQMMSSFPPLNFTEKWRSEPNPGGSYFVSVGDIDNDGKTELVYFFNAVWPDSTRRLVVYENTGNDTYAVDWDTTVYTLTEVFGISDIDNDGHKEIITTYSPRGINILPTVALLECYGPRQYRFYNTNIGFQRQIFEVKESDVNHNGIKELTVLTSNSSVPQDPTLIYIAEFVGKGPGMMAFNGQIARFYGYSFHMAIGQVDGVGWDEIIPAGGSFGFHEPVPVVYLWYSGVPGPLLWKPREIYTGLESGTGAVMFVNLDADTAKEFVSGAPGPIGHGSMFALKYLRDTTWSVLWADSSLRNAPLWVNAGTLSGQRVVAGANTWQRIALDTLYSELHTYSPEGNKLGIWRKDSASIQQFHLTDIDSDNRTNLNFAKLSQGPPHYLMDFEIDSVTGLGEVSTPNEFKLEQNYPNPFNPSTTVKFSLPKRERVSLRVYDLLGKNVVTLVEGLIDAGEHSAVWDASHQASGIYFYRLETTNSSTTKKMILMR